MAGNPVIRYSNSAGDYTLVDGVVVDERRPPGGILGVPGNKVCCVGEFERGPLDTVLSFGSSDQLTKTMGGLGPDDNGDFYDGALSLRGKSWGRLYVVRVSNSNQANAFLLLDDSGALPVISAAANSVGNWGNSLSIEITDPTSGIDATEFDLILRRDGLVVERHRNIDYADVADSGTIPITSDYIALTKLGQGNDRPDVLADTTLANGDDGTFSDSDYTGIIGTNTKGIAALYGDAATDIRWTFCGNQYSSAINSALELLTTNAITKNAIIQGSMNQTVSGVASDVADYRSDRIGYGYPWVNIWVAEANNNTGALVSVGPASFIANTLAAMEPGQNPAGPNGVPFLKGIRALVNPNITNADYEDFRAKGIMGLQFTKEAGNYEIRSGINTSLDTALHNWARRNMADYIQVSAADYLVTFRNARINTKNKLEIKVALEDFLDQQIRFGVLPSESDLNDNRAPGTERLLTYIVDIASLNSPEQEATGIFVVSLRVRIHATMDFLVFRTEIGERVEISESGL
jgi:hypothetical protein